MGWWEDLINWIKVGPDPIQAVQNPGIVTVLGAAITAIGIKTVEELLAIKIRGSFVEALGLLRWLSVPANKDEVRGMRAALETKVLTFGYTEFQALWATARQYVGLQSRLALEQIFWNLDRPWRDLVTGFKAINIGGSTGGGPPPPPPPGAF